MTRAVWRAGRADTPNVMRVLAVLVTALCVLVAGTAAAQASVRPGAVTTTGGASCTANFLFTDGSHTYLGQAAHCSGLGAADELDGCRSEVRPIGTRVRIQGARHAGTLAYSAWNEMRANGEDDAATCAYNDFALVRLHRDDARAADPTVPRFGGPEGLGAPGGAGSSVYSFQNSTLRGGRGLLGVKSGGLAARHGGGWGYSVYTVTPGLPGDSGSGFMTRDGRAFGVLSTLAVLPLPLSNGVTDLGRAVAYARQNAVPGLRLIPGRRDFRPRIL